MSAADPSHVLMPADDRAVLRQQFRDQSADKHPERWDDLWKRRCTPWDRNGPSMALRDTVTQRLGSPLRADGRTRKRALVPGCGRGYDVLLLSALGYDTYGLDASETAVEAARTVQCEAAGDEIYAAWDEKIGRGEARFLRNDFFQGDFLRDTDGGDFDAIYDYTFLCALPPELRPKWAKRMSELLAPDGHLVCLEWPLGKPPSEGGPPHGLTSDLYVQLFRRPGEEVAYDEGGVLLASVNERSEAALSRVEHFMPERTHEAGKGRDWVSVWRHVGA